MIDSASNVFICSDEDDRLCIEYFRQRQCAVNDAQTVAPVDMIAVPFPAGDGGLQVVRT
jgi:hypothetical protein